MIKYLFMIAGILVTVWGITVAINDISGGLIVAGGLLLVGIGVALNPRQPNPGMDNVPNEFVSEGLSTNRADNE